MMKSKTLVFIFTFFLTAFTSGQSTYDLLLKAKAFNDTGSPVMAVELLNVSSAVPTDSRLLTVRAEAKLLIGDFQGAISDFNSANKITQYSGEYGLARVYAIKGDAATALYHLEINMKSSFRKSEKEIMLDPAFAKIENKPEWRLFWKKEWYSVADRKLSEVEFYVRAGNVDEARSVTAELERDYPGNHSSVYAGALVKNSSGRYGEAVKSLSDLVAAEPDNEQYLRALASAQIAGSNPSGASETYSKLISMEIPDAELLLLRAECYRKTGEREKAIADIKKYLSFYPESKAALSLAGKTESASGNSLKALEYLSENLRLHPNDPECYIDRGNSYFMSKSWQWAINDYSMSLDLDPNNSDAWLSKGISLVNSGKTEDACHDFRRSFALGNKKATEYISKYCLSHMF
ncbi:MAG: tetratricopeptide repeat protein [Bacteroidales bacterium]|jgi:tetratricopeptide (TPR) repeat protein|nr:tetratricopeptide repeat protein [Bacteroidales bacterium]